MSSSTFSVLMSASPPSPDLSVMSKIEPSISLSSSLCSTYSYIHTSVVATTLRLPFSRRMLPTHLVLHAHLCFEEVDHLGHAPTVQCLALPCAMVLCVYVCYCRACDKAVSERRRRRRTCAIMGHDEPRSVSEQPCGLVPPHSILLGPP